MTHEIIVWESLLTIPFHRKKWPVLPFSTLTHNPQNLLEGVEQSEYFQLKFNIKNFVDGAMATI